MNNMQLKSVLCLSILLAGCATSSFPRYESYAGADAACVEGKEWPNLIKLYSEGEAHVWLKEVDGLPTTSEDKVCMAPGVHVVGVRAHNRHEYSTIRMKFDFLPNTHYLVRANKLGITFHYKILNAKEGSTDALAKAEAPISSGGGANYVPIFIPAGK